MVVNIVVNKQYLLGFWEIARQQKNKDDLKMDYLKRLEKFDKLEGKRFKKNYDDMMMIDFN